MEPRGHFITARFVDGAVFCFTVMASSLPSGEKWRTVSLNGREGVRRQPRRMPTKEE
jgi:hypothetical protein